MGINKKIYLASPLGFSESTFSFMQKIETSLIELGYVIINPWRLTNSDEFERIGQILNENERIKAYRKLNLEIGTRNENAINESEIILAILDGTDVDSGTASEIGYAFAKNKRIIGYRNDFRMAGENPGSIINIQVEYWILKSNGIILHDLRELIEYFKNID
ncbi:MAG: 2-deoxyribonucleoside glycosidase [Candidatus Lokiarchaeota archaeon]|nr:2-deoxyribonucleoside glycosidase [Candidatus Lokiarchaeota archaeon]